MLCHYCKSFPWSTSTKKIKKILGYLFFYVSSQTYFIQLMLVLSYFISVMTKPAFSLQELEAGLWKHFQTGSSQLQQNVLHLLKVSSDDRDSLKHKPLFSPFTFKQLWLQTCKNYLWVFSWLAGTMANKSLIYKFCQPEQQQVKNIHRNVNVLKT